MTIILRSRFFSSARRCVAAQWRASTMVKVPAAASRSAVASNKWAVYFSQGRLAACKRCLRCTVAATGKCNSYNAHGTIRPHEAHEAEATMSQRVRMTTRSRNPLRAVLVWPHAVKWHNVSRLIRIAKKSNPSFRIVGTPVAVGGRILPAARAAVSGRNNAKKLQLPPPPSAPAAAAPAASASSAALLAAVTRFLPASSLNMKWWHIHSHWQNCKGFLQFCHIGNFMGHNFGQRQDQHGLCRARVRHPAPSGD